jgi:hypothetical protein
MAETSSGYCLGCGKELPETPTFHGKAYRVCTECAAVMQQGNHKDFFKVMKTVSRNLDSARVNKTVNANPEPSRTAWINAIGI